MRKQAILILFALVIVSVTAVPSYSQYDDAISREFTAYVDTSPAACDDAISREFTVYVDTSPAACDDAISREFTVYVDTSPAACDDAISREFTVFVGDFTATSIIPSSGNDSGNVNITDLAGTGFQAGATVKLTRPGQSDIVATGVNVVSSTNITCSFDLTDKALGQWNVVVTNPDAVSAILSDGFTITNGTPGHYAWTEYNGHWYALTPWGSWQQCEAEAQAVGGHLVTINDAEENAWVTGFIKDSYTRQMQGDPGNNIAWIGYDNGVWSSGEPVTYTNLDTAYPIGKVFILGENYAAWHLPPGLWTAENFYLHNGTFGYNPQGVIERSTFPEPPPSSDKRGENGSTITLQNMVVTHAVSDSFYAEKDNRTWGIRVEGYSSALELGRRVNIIGKLRTNSDGERYIQTDSVELLDSPSVKLGPLGVTNKVLGGGNLAYDPGTGAGQTGVTSGSGLNNIGLLVKTTGRVTYVDANTFAIDDGSGVSVTCITPSTITVNSGWQYVSVTGISSIKKTGETYDRLLRVISVDPIIIDIAMPSDMGRILSAPAGDFLRKIAGLGDGAKYSNLFGISQRSDYLSAYSIGKYQPSRKDCLANNKCYTDNLVEQFDCSLFALKMFMPIAFLEN